MATWTDVGASTLVTAGGIPRRVDVEGFEVVIWRTADGVIAALDDRCAHHEIRLSLGVIVDDCIVCPAHGWTFDRDGWTVPMATVRVQPWEVREVDGRIEVDADSGG